MAQVSIGLTRSLVAAAIACCGVVAVFTSAVAHEGIASSSPPSGSTVADPIDVVTIDFGTEIGDAVELALIGPDDEALPSTTTMTSPTTAKVEFETLTAKGTYFVQYLAPSVTDGDLIVGAISFTYGSAPGRSVVPWVLFGIAAVLILAVGAWFSRRAAGSLRGR